MFKRCSKRRLGLLEESASEDTHVQETRRPNDTERTETHLTHDNTLRCVDLRSSQSIKSECYPRTSKRRQTTRPKHADNCSAQVTTEQRQTDFGEYKLEETNVLFLRFSSLGMVCHLPMFTHRPQAPHEMMEKHLRRIRRWTDPSTNWHSGKKPPALFISYLATSQRKTRLPMKL